MDKMRFSLKVSKQTYGLKTGHKIQNVSGNIILTSHPIAHIFLL
jgi:hypothetical protein